MVCLSIVILFNFKILVLGIQAKTKHISVKIFLFLITIYRSCCCYHSGLSDQHIFDFCTGFTTDALPHSTPILSCLGTGTKSSLITNLSVARMGNKPRK